MMFVFVFQFLIISKSYFQPILSIMMIKSILQNWLSQTIHIKFHRFKLPYIYFKIISNFLLLNKAFKNEEQLGIKLTFADMKIYLSTFTSDASMRVDCITHI